MDGSPLFLVVCTAVIHRFALILIGILLAGLAMEAVLRVADPIPEVGSPLSAFFMGDPYLGWRGRPNVRLRFHRPEFDTLVLHDAAGWRQGDPPPPGDAARRVLVLGDSFTWGWGVDQGELFTDRLQARFAPTTAVDNRGAVAFGTTQEYLLLQRELRSSHDTVLLMFYINDLANNVDGDGARPVFDLAGGDLLLRNSPAPVPRNGFDSFAAAHSRAYAFLEFALGTVKRRFRGEAGDERAYRTAPAVNFHDLPGYAVTARLLDEMNRFTHAHGARFVLVYIPQRSEFEADAPYPYVAAVHAMMDDITRRAGIGMIDLAPAFREQTRSGGALVYPIDAHWTAAGHAVAAEQILGSELFRPTQQ